MEKGRVLVTGATGFIGSYLVDELVRQGYNVRALVRKTSNIGDLEKNGVELFYGDLTDTTSLKDIAQDIDIVFHLAAQVDRPGITPEEYEQANLDGTKNLVESCIGTKIKKFIFFSSIAAMGIRNIGRVDENSPLKPNIYYGKSKQKIEEILLSYYKKNKFPLVIIRPPTVYGPTERYNFLTLCRAIKNGPFMIIGKGNNLMDLCWIGNLINATILAGKKGVPGSVYLIADARPYTVNEVVQTIAKAEGVKIPEFHLPLWLAYFAGLALEIFGKMFRFHPPLYTRRVRTMTSNFYFDISKARKELGYQPEDNFEKFVQKTVEYYTKNNQL